MGRHKFRLSDMIPNAWLFKLRDMRARGGAAAASPRVAASRQLEHAEAPRRRRRRVAPAQGVPLLHAAGGGPRRSTPRPPTRTSRRCSCRRRAGLPGGASVGARSSWRSGRRATWAHRGRRLGSLAALAAGWGGSLAAPGVGEGSWRIEQNEELFPLISGSDE
jgi:hypothetical protein